MNSSIKNERNLVIFKKLMRIISRVDIKNNFVIKGIQMEGLKKINV